MNDVHENKTDRFLNVFPKILFAVTITLFGVVLAIRLLRPAEHDLYWVATTDAAAAAAVDTMAMDTMAMMDTMSVDTIRLGEGVEVSTVWDSLLADSMFLERLRRDTAGVMLIQTDSTGGDLVAPRHIRISALSSELGRGSAVADGIGTVISATTIDFKGAMAAVITLVLLIAALWVILSKRYQDAEKKWAFGIIGTIVGYWLSP